MEMSRMLLICAALVACVYAGQKKSMMVKVNDFCEKYTGTSNSLPCGVNDTKTGKPLCYLSKDDHVKCDSVKDCPNFADEKGCKQEHDKYCDTGFDGKNLTAYHCAPFTADGFPENDVMCIASTQVCDRTSDCPQGDDEEDCPPQ